MYHFTEEQQKIRDRVREFTEKEVAPRDAWMDVHGFDRELHKKIADAGLMGVHIPEEYGGGGGDAVTSAIVLHEMAKGSASAALFLDASWLASDCILQHGTEQQKRKYLPMAAKGSIFAFGLTEGCAGSDAAGIQSTAVLDGEEWVVNGGKAWITNAGVADVYLILAKTDPQAGARGISAFLVEAQTPGLTVEKTADKMGMRGTSTTELVFENLRLPREALLGKEGQGFKIAMIALDGARVSVAAISTGLAEHAMAEAKKYANQRVAFGKPIAKYQGISYKFADMAVSIHAMTLMTYHGAQMRADGQRYTLEAAEAKLFSSEMCNKICNECLQVFGGFGYSRDCPAERFVRDARFLQIGEGTSEILRMLIGNTVLAQ